MARSVVGNRATSGGDHRPIVRSITASDDRSYDQSHVNISECKANEKAGVGIFSPPGAQLVL